MDHIADRILDHGDLRAALRDLLRQGAQLPSGRHLSGLRDLLERLRERRQQHQHNDGRCRGQAGSDRFYHARITSSAALAAKGLRGTA
ncbi:MAG: hypothetical protein K6U88_17205 [Dehalococcoidia bacterium]|nr:hypothetical protein [Dehalococcoidia bacterium]